MPKTIFIFREAGGELPGADELRQKGYHLSEALAVPRTDIEKRSHEQDTQRKSKKNSPAEKTDRRGNIFIRTG
ncbi:hypothetical protein [Pseudodesulfovibrio piezophilus]|uniref:hypothetical protein n=1 Tax=Pseudodesulfovibrio piezophilus TaxID=879567 RepID=UPI00034BB8DB|nr:hypothetical protein [Pseudodesulfovibrio piezophilus]